MSLTEIALGDARPSEALVALGRALAGQSPDSAQDVYTALRAWVWKALDARRRDPELKDWYDIIRRTQTFLADTQAVHAERLKVLAELLFESITISETLVIGDVLKRRHIRDLLTLLSAAPEGRMERVDIGKGLRLKQANLSRILNLASYVGLIERIPYGRNAMFRLTRCGLNSIADLNYTGVAARPATRREQTMAIAAIDSAQRRPGRTPNAAIVKQKKDTQHEPASPRGMRWSSQVFLYSFTEINKSQPNQDVFSPRIRRSTNRSSLGSSTSSRERAQETTRLGL
jgi:hypothetical protein